MKNLLLLTFVCFISIAANCQKIKIKDDIATVDGVNFLKWEKRASANEISISGMSSEGEEISGMYLNYVDPNKISKANPEGKVRWIEIYFVTMDLRCEVATRTSKGLAEMIYENNIYVDGTLNQENVQKFVKKYGMKFTDGRPGNNVNIIINN